MGESIPMTAASSIVSALAGVLAVPLWIAVACLFAYAVHKARNEG